MTHQVHIEIERKYDVDADALVPDLTGIGPVASVSAPQTATLAAVYFDTADLALAAQRIVLRRRTGGSDEGWHIKLPGVEGHVELHWPLGEEGPIPASVLDLVMVHVRNREVAPVARITTTRTTTCLFDADGVAVAEVCDDLVSAGSAASGELRVWREWEVELTDDAPGSPRKREALLDSIEKQLRSAGASPASSVSKLAHALGRERLGEAGPRWVLTSRSTAGEVLRAAIAALTQRLIAADPQVRQDEAGAVHEMRSTIRRMRSVFASYRDLLSSPDATFLESELGALGEVLGGARDPQVMRDRARNLVRSQANKSMHEAVLVRVVAQKEVEYQRALGYLRRLMTSARYFQLLDALEAFTARSSFNRRSERPASRALAEGVATDYSRVRRRMAEVDRAANAAEWNERTHRVRKAARRLRFAVEALSTGDTAIFGEKTGRLAVLGEKVQDALGEYRDSVLLQRLLLASAEGAYAEGENTFGYGRLFAIEQQRADQAIEEYSRARGEFTMAKKWVPSS